MCSTYNIIILFCTSNVCVCVCVKDGSERPADGYNATAISMHTYTNTCILYRRKTNANAHMWTGQDGRVDGGGRDHRAPARIFTTPTRVFFGSLAPNPVFVSCPRRTCNQGRGRGAAAFRRIRVGEKPEIKIPNRSRERVKHTHFSRNVPEPGRYFTLKNRR